MSAPVTTWANDGRPEWVPTYIPSVDAIKRSFVPAVDNVKANIQQPGKNMKEAAIEVTILVVEVVAFLMAILGIAPAAPPWALAQLTGLALLVVGAFYFVAAAATISSSLSFLPTPNPGMVTFIREGVFAHCRHPMYFGMVTFAVGLSLVSLSPWRMCWTTVMWVALEKKADIEELCLTEQFPESYIAYAATRPKFIPGRIVSNNKEYAQMDDTIESPIVVDKIAE